MKKIIFAMLTISIISVAAQNEGGSKNYMGLTWSPDGKYLSFTIMDIKSMKPMNMSADIYVMKADGTEMKKITAEDNNKFGPSWSKDGKRIYFGMVNPTSKEAHIFSINTDGSGLTQLTKTGRN